MMTEQTKSLLQARLMTPGFSATEFFDVAHILGIYQSNLVDDVAHLAGSGEWRMRLLSFRDLEVC